MTMDGIDAAPNVIPEAGAGLPDWVAALEGTPAWGSAPVEPTIPIITEPSTPDVAPNAVVSPSGVYIPPGVPEWVVNVLQQEVAAQPGAPSPAAAVPQRRASAGPTGQNPFPTVPVVPGAVPGVPITPVASPISGGVVGDALTGIGNIASRLTSAVGSAAAAAFDALRSVTDRLLGIAGDVLQKAIPTISELAMGIAASASQALTFLADNLTDAADLGLSLAQGIATPFELLFAGAGRGFAEAIVAFLEQIAQAIAGVMRQYAAPNVEQLI